MVWKHLMGITSMVSLPFILYIAYQSGKTVENIKNLHDRLTKLEQMHYRIEHHNKENN